MPAIDYPAWIVLVFGVYAFSAGIGEFRAPGFWEKMVVDLERVAALRFLTGIICIGIGTPLYLMAPWGSSDWMVVAVKIIGGWMVIEGALFLAVGDWFVAFARRLMGFASRTWALLSVVLGLAAIVVAAMRI